MIVEKKVTNKKTGKTTTSYKKLTPITKSEFNSGGKYGEKAYSRKLTASTGAGLTLEEKQKMKNRTSALSTTAARKEKIKTKAPTKSVNPLSTTAARKEQTARRKKTY